MGGTVALMDEKPVTLLGGGNTMNEVEGTAGPERGKCTVALTGKC